VESHTRGSRSDPHVPFSTGVRGGERRCGYRAGMRVGLYVDGFNLYYGARALCGRSTPGWRWLDVRALGERLVARSSWTGASIERVVHCTARVSGTKGQTGQHDQDTYLRALREHASADIIAMGNYVSRVATAPLAVADRRKRPVLSTSAWPV
jgi:hypothetical protein